MGIYSPVALAAVIVATALDKLTGGLLTKLAGDGPSQADKSKPADHPSSARPADEPVAARPAAPTLTARKDSVTSRVDRPVVAAITPALDDDEPTEPSAPGLR